ncbi:putative serine/threonine-protein kinase roco9 [Senna tora]|uniref:Putative serine/threonine-protein kinase roco9 n=1 Tax=Senna tora TaxID=362788 RepID=A0A834TB66_9FABA|nr:putative serine/threonine-protein kinase roco9 [Senna tora]
MYSLTVKPSFIPQLPSTSTSSSLSSTILASFRSRSLSSIPFPRNLKQRGRLFIRVQAYDSSKNDTSNTSGDSKSSNGTLSKSRREILLEYVKNVQPEFMELFVKRAPQQVVDAMRQTVTNMIGTLPPQFFAVTITTVAENLAQLMYSVMMTGYMFSNAQYRLELQESLEQVALPDVKDKKDIPDYAPGTQKNVTGEVIRWNNVSGPERIDAKKYIELLEAEIEELNRQVGRQSSNAQNELLEYLKSLEPQNLKELTSSAGEDVVLAMNTFIKRLLAVSDPSQMKTSVTETSAPELAKLLYWLMVVGYSIRNIEVRYDMERVLGTPPKLAELPPGESI